MKEALPGLAPKTIAHLLELGCQVRCLPVVFWSGTAAATIERDGTVLVTVAAPRFPRNGLNQAIDFAVEKLSREATNDN